GSCCVSSGFIALDPHPVGGSSPFSTGKPSALGPAPAEAAALEAWSRAATLNRLLFLVGLLGAAGGILFHGVVARDLRRMDAPGRQSLIALAVLGCLSALLAIGLEGGALAGGDIRALLDPAAWRLGASTNLGPSRLITAFCLGIAAVLLDWGWKRSPVPLLTLAALSLTSLALTGHALAAGPPLLTGPMLALHVALAA